jgi:hypothetical protein
VIVANLGSSSRSSVLVSHVHLVGEDISLEKNFYRLPFTPPSLVASSVLQQEHIKRDEKKFRGNHGAPV